MLKSSSDSIDALGEIQVQCRLQRSLESIAEFKSHLLRLNVLWPSCMLVEYTSNGLV